MSSLSILLCYALVSPSLSLVQHLLHICACTFPKFPHAERFAPYLRDLIGSVLNHEHARFCVNFRLKLLTFPLVPQSASRVRYDRVPVLSCFVGAYAILSLCPW